MKSIKILLPAALTFTMFIGMNSSNAQSLAFNHDSSPIVNIAKANSPKKSIGLDYRTTLAQVNHVLVNKLKTNRAIDFQGKVLINISMNAEGKITSVNFDKELPQELASNIKSVLTANNYEPVKLNGISKAQLFSIPLRIK